MSAAIIIHGGIKEFENIDSTVLAMQQELRAIALNSHRVLLEEGARKAVLGAVVDLEDCELFNAGTGSRIQSDGRIRMSASLMDGENTVFSGIINVQEVKNPILVAAHLASESNTVLAGEPATDYARALGFEAHDPYTEHRLNEHRAGNKGQTGTVGAVALDASGKLFAATSTGGVGGETPGRVSDSATVAGNYASLDVGISCTGSGEQIVNLGVATRIATRMSEGIPLRIAVNRTIDEGRTKNYVFGLIAIDEHGVACVEQTQGQTLYAIANEDGITTFS